MVLCSNIYSFLEIQSVFSIFKLCNNWPIILLTIIGSIISIGFGIWHFFVPYIWNWYSYIVPEATELIIAVKAINFFFSLLLILLGVANILCVFNFTKGNFQPIIIFSLSVLLWATGVILQVFYPQGSQNQIIQYGMLLIFLIVWACFTISLILLLTQKEIKTRTGQVNGDDC